MCARRFLGCVFFLILLAVAGAFAIFQFGDRILASMGTPKGHFEQPRDPGPDYAKSGNWLAKPGVGDDLTGWRPQAADGAVAAPPVAMTPAAATFYVHPTTYLQNDRWNGPIGAKGEPEQRARLFVQSQSTAFADLSTIWAPRYRQAAFGAFLLTSEDANKALDLAYSDVLRAFDAFLTANPAGPVILAGHSQGSLHLLRLMRDRKDALKDRLVGAYIAGWPIDAEADLPVMGAQVCSEPEQSGCVMSWQSFTEPANPDLVLRAWVGTKGLTGTKRERDQIICTNPLSGNRNPAPAAANQGTLVPNGELSSGTLQQGLMGARCEDGFLLVDGEVPDMGRYVLPGNNYHVYDYALWWGSIRADAQRRLAAWRA